VPFLSSIVTVSWDSFIRKRTSFIAIIGLWNNNNKYSKSLSLSLAAVNHSVDPERLKIYVLNATHCVTAQLHLTAKDAHRAVHLQRSAQTQGREQCVLVRLEIGAVQAARPVVQSDDQGTGRVDVAVDSVNNNATDSHQCWLVRTQLTDKDRGITGQNSRLVHGFSKDSSNDVHSEAGKRSSLLIHQTADVFV
jgi:hypothetical protein